MSKDDDFLEIAIEEATSAAARGEVPVGAALISQDGLVLARDGNRILELRDPSAHAEMLVLRAAAASAANERLVGTTLYVSLEPCTMCVGVISLARIDRLVYAASDPKGGAVENGVKFFQQPTCHHRPLVERINDGGRSGNLLREFFQARRT